MSARFEIRALTLGEILDEAFVLFRGAALRMVAFQLIAFVPTALVEVWLIRAIAARAVTLMSTGSGFDFTQVLVTVLLGALAVLAIQLMVAPLVGVALTRAVADVYLDRPWTTRGLIATAIRFAGRAITLGLVMVTLLMLVALVPLSLAGAVAWGLVSTGQFQGASLILLVVVVALLVSVPLLAVGIHVYLRYVLSFVSLAIEDLTVIQALRRASALMKGRYWSGFGLWLVLMLVSVLFGLAVTMFVPAPSFETLDPDRLRQIIPQLARSQILTTLLGEVMGMFTRTFILIAWTLFYFSARCTREGFDLMVLTERVNAEVASASARGPT